jgi:anti-sigma-K factor RskA
VTGNEHIAQEDLALYALQALSEEESVALRSHLDQCAFCRNELAALFGDTALIGLSVPQHPVPAGARQRFLNRIAAEAFAAKQGIEQQARGRVLPFRGNAWIPWAAAAVLAITAISLGVKNISLDKELRDESNKVANLANQSAQAQRVLDVLTSPTAQHVLLTAARKPAEPTGRVIYLADSGGLVFQVNNLKQLASDKTYELWLIPVSGKPVPAGLFRPDAAGSASVVMPPLPKGIAAKAFGVTMEQAEGSTTPTAPILLSGATSSNAGD